MLHSAPLTSNYALADSGAMMHLFHPSAPIVPFQEKRHIRVALPDGSILLTSMQCALSVDGLSKSLAKGYILSGLAHHSLISMSKLCNDECTVAFTATDVSVTKNNNIIWTGARDPDTKLWTLPLITNAQDAQPNERTSPTMSVNSVFEITSIKNKLLYLHACAGYPTKSTWLKAVRKGYFKSWPVLTHDLIARYLTEQVPKIKGHLNQTRMNVRSTQRA